MLARGWTVEMMTSGQSVEMLSSGRTVEISARGRTVEMLPTDRTIEMLLSFVSTHYAMMSIAVELKREETLLSCLRAEVILRVRELCCSCGPQEI